MENTRRKPFDLEKAKEGAKLVTGDGKPARIVCYDRKNKIDKCENIIALIDEGDYEVASPYYNNGRMYSEKDTVYDLFILEESTYRPYANAKEMDAAVKEHGSFVENLHGRRFSITTYDNDYVCVGVGWQTIRYEEFFKGFTWLNGHPCGVEDESN